MTSADASANDRQTSAAKPSTVQLTSIDYDVIGLNEVRRRVVADSELLSDIRSLEDGEVGIEVHGFAGDFLDNDGLDDLVVAIQLDSPFLLLYVLRHNGLALNVVSLAVSNGPGILENVSMYGLDGTNFIIAELSMVDRSRGFLGSMSLIFDSSRNDWIKVESASEIRHLLANYDDDPEPELAVIDYVSPVKIYDLQPSGLEENRSVSETIETAVKEFAAAAQSRDQAAIEGVWEKYGDSISTNVGLILGGDLATFYLRALHEGRERGLEPHQVAADLLQVRLYEGTIDAFLLGDYKSAAVSFMIAAIVRAYRTGEAGRWSGAHGYQIMEDPDGAFSLSHGGQIYLNFESPEDARQFADERIRREREEYYEWRPVEVTD